MKSRSPEFYLEWDIKPLKHSVSVCPYVGTNYCTYVCEAHKFIPCDCTLDCEECSHLDDCPCSYKSLPREIAFRNNIYWLFPPQWTIHKTKKRFQSLYGYYPTTICYIREFNIKIAGPIQGVISPKTG